MLIVIHIKIYYLFTARRKVVGNDIWNSAGIGTFQIMFCIMIL